MQSFLGLSSWPSLQSFDLSRSAAAERAIAKGVFCDWVRVGGSACGFFELCLVARDQGACNACATQLAAARPAFGGLTSPQRVFLLGGPELIRRRPTSSARTQCTGGTAQVIVRLWAHSIIYSVSTTTEATSLISLEIDVKISLNLGSPGQAVAGTALSILGTALEIAGFGTPMTTY